MTTPLRLAARSNGSTGSAPKNPDLAGHRRRMRDKVIDKSAAIKVTESAALHLSHSRIINQSVLRNWFDVQDYCINRLAHERREHFIILYLGNQNRLISEETMSVGTVNQTAVYTREVVNAALKHQAQAVILLHNHPSGELKPSRADIDVTRDIEKALAVMGIALHDHLIIADTTCVSFKSLGHL